MPFTNALAKGTWTPTILGGAGVDKGHTYSQQTGVWTRLGNLVFIHGQAILASLNTIDGSVVVMGGLPFPVRNDSLYRPVGVPRWSLVTFAGIPSMTGVYNTSYVSMVTYASAGATTNLIDSALASTSSFSVEMVYETDL
tara:strand:+ start:3857 stop:4276 length:420 start_codon:yes stop_codon:yes gene_type:complete